jgi:PAS domain S-box-containing protein
MVQAGHTEESIRTWLRSQRFPVGGGINGLAAQLRKTIWTEDYRADPRWPHESGDDSADRLELGAVVVAPLLGPGAEVIGTLAITYRVARPIDPRDVTLVEELARQASIAARNAQLYSELRESSAALADSERRYRYLLDHSPDLVWEIDAEGAVTYVGEAIERITGYTAKRVLGRYWVSLFMPDSMSESEAVWRAIRERPDEEQLFRVNVPLEKGGTISAEISMIGKVENGQFAGAHGSLRDITERSRLEEALRRRSAELAANEERASLARELHDSVTQALFSMGLTLSTVELLLDRDPVAARKKFAEVRELQADALAEMRTLIFELRPRGLETDGLGQALRNHANAVAGRTGLSITVESEVESRLSPENEQALYRIAQEALHNVVKHAGARTARIRLTQTASEVQVAVEDDGAGFDPAGVSGTKLGLIAMRQRAERLGGTLEVHSREGRGTRVTVTVPLAEPARVSA